MAVWQVDFYVVPRQAIGSQPLTRAALNQTQWWANARFPNDYRTRLAAVAPPAPSSSAQLETWGDDATNRVDVWSATGRVERVTARVDVRRLDSKFGAALIAFARTAQAVFVRDDGLVVEPTIAAYAGALRSSSAWRYASDPAAFLAAHDVNDDSAE